MSEAWIGFSDLTTEGTFEWTIPQKHGTSKKYKNWKQGEPNNFNGIEDCGALASIGIWNDIPCTWKKAYICEFSKENKSFFIISLGLGLALHFLQIVPFRWLKISYVFLSFGHFLQVSREIRRKFANLVSNTESFYDFGRVSALEVLIFL